MGDIGLAINRQQRLRKTHPARLAGGEQYPLNVSRHARSAVRLARYQVRGRAVGSSGDTRLARGLEASELHP
jgi:hypothetical protein